MMREAKNAASHDTLMSAYVKENLLIYFRLLLLVLKEENFINSFVSEIFA